MFRVAKDLRFSPSRRSFALGGAALIVSAAAGPAFARSVDAFVDSVWVQAKARGVPRKVFDAAMGSFQPLDKVMALTRKQPEFTSTVADYVGKRVTDKQAATGQGKQGEWAQTLAAVEGRTLNTMALAGLIGRGAMGWDGLLADARYGAARGRQEGLA